MAVWTLQGRQGACALVYPNVKDRVCDTAYATNVKTTHGFHFGRLQAGLNVIPFMAAVMILIHPATLEAESSYRKSTDDKIIVESGEASQVDEKIRAESAGTMMALFVKVGDPVKKGQLLGHTELAATKLQYDLAKQALENNANLEGMLGQADAWTATREETEVAVRRREVNKTRLEWAEGMEKFFRSSYEAQLEQKKVQKIQYDHWKEQYESRFFRAPVDGYVTEVLVEIGKQVSFGTHVFTVENQESYVVPVSVSADDVGGILPTETLPVRVAESKHVTCGRVESVEDDPSTPGRKIIRLLVNEKDIPFETTKKNSILKFDVLLPKVVKKKSIADTPDPAQSHTASTVSYEERR